MALDPGTRLGPYEVLTVLGTGGMGEVYRARDTRLDRTVAIKVLPPHLSRSPEMRERFEREARTVSQLSHPNICSLYDVGRSGETAFVVMEYLEGETLAARIAKGPIPVEQAIRIGAELADALEQAHRRGIVHRDVKPGNVMLTRSGAKLLDFGLAKAAPAVITGAGGSGDHTALATTAPLTGQGTILGTVQYMAPEQLEGREADARTDIFALGAVLYEMVSGRKAFDASSQASLVSAIMSVTPPTLSSFVPSIPPLLDRLVRSCLEKDPGERVQTAHDILLQLRWTAESSEATSPTPPARPVAATAAWLPWILAAAAIVAAAWLALALAGAGPAAPPARVVRSTILLPEGIALGSAVISPAADRIAFSGTDATGTSLIWVRQLDTETVTRIAGTEGGILPFWSPDGRDIGFVSDKTIKRVDAGGATAPIQVYEADATGAAWTPRGDILFSVATGPILRVSANGGAASPVTTLDARRGETSHRYPFLLPDGRHFLFLAFNPASRPHDPVNQICVASLDGGPASRIAAANYNPLYSSGHLLFMRGGSDGGSLLGRPFDPVRLEVTGPPLIVAGYAAMYGDFAGLGSPSVSRTGTLLFDASRVLTRLELYDRSGRLTGRFGNPAPRADPSLSPDGAHAAYNVYDVSTQTTQVWVADLTRGVETRLTSPPSSNLGPIWMPDGGRIAFDTDASHQKDVLIRAADGSGDVETITNEFGEHKAFAISSDGQTMIVYDREPGGDRNVALYAYTLSGERTRSLVVRRGATNVLGASLSPDGRWLAFDSDQWGRREVFVVSCPEGRNRVQVSIHGGTDPRWARNGRELLYLSPDRQIMTVAVEPGAAFRAESPVPLFSVPEAAAGRWDVTRDGERFLFAVAALKSSSVPLTLVQDWAAALKR